MTNFDRWQLYMKDLNCPQSFVDFGFYYTVSVALQRRVWCGPEHMPLYPNLYIILVGEPGIGKGIAIKPVNRLLKHHQLDINGAEKVDKTDGTDEIREVLEFAQKFNSNNPAAAKEDDDKQLFPSAADATTYEALVQSMARSTRMISYKAHDKDLQKEVKKIYTHSSVYFCLEEISSLFRRHTEDVVNFLLVAFDCGDYEYRTKTQGRDRIKRCCLSLFGGTTPQFMHDTFNSKLLGEGFSSRTIFIFESANRKNDLFIPSLSSEQVSAMLHIQTHVRNLSRLYGHAQFSPEAKEYLEDWWQKHQALKPNTSPKLIPYYSRKNIHAMKLATIMHFSETADSMTIERASCEKAIAALDGVEKNMHYAVSFASANPLHATMQKIVKCIGQYGPQDFIELFMRFSDEVREAELRECINALIVQNKIALNKGKYQCR